MINYVYDHRVYYKISGEADYIDTLRPRMTKI
jgi:hypothetical protein